MKRGEMLDKALHLAVNAHHGQFDKGGKPYILHPLRVMSFLKSDDEELQCMALLHDVVEDTDTTYNDLIYADMSLRVVEGIRALTKERGYTYDQYKEKIFKNRDAMQVKMADLRHNTDIRRLKGVTEKDIARMAKYHTFYLELRTKLEIV
jgi:(p)ppGpp synthase/HD superfamily hydrolase